MNILCFDTCCGYFSVAVYKNGQCSAYFKSEIFNHQSEMLPGKIKECLSISKLNFNEINYLAVTLGPGSFTGIRIGLAVAQGISIASDNRPIIGVTTLETIAYGIQGKSKVAFDAGNNKFFVQEFINGVASSEIVMQNYEKFNSGNRLFSIICNPSKGLNLPSADKIGIIALNKIVKMKNINSYVYEKLQPIYT
jgi:tRNA threonylcarbamoyladenosine biosynthesis protein TsaB